MHARATDLLANRILWVKNALVNSRQPALLTYPRRLGQLICALGSVAVLIRIVVSEVEWDYRIDHSESGPPSLTHVV